MKLSVCDIMSSGRAARDRVQGFEGGGGRVQGDARNQRLQLRLRITAHAGRGESQRVIGESFIPRIWESG